MPDGINNVDTTIVKLATEYQATLVKSSELNDQRANIRENVEKLGISAEAFQVGLRMAKGMTKGERADYSDSLTRVLSAIDGKEADLFGADEIAARDKRADKRERKKQEAGTPREKQDAKSDKNKRSNPDTGGAGKGKGKAANANAAPPPSEQRPPLQPDGTPWPDDAPIMITDQVTGATRPETGDELIARVAKEKNAEREQREGGQILANAGKGLVDNGGENPKPKSQTELSKEKLAAAGLH